MKSNTRAIEAAEVHVKCGHCSGTGKVIHNRMTQAIRALSREWVSTAFVAKKVGVSTTNAANLLRQLFDAEKVERRGAGHGYEWRHGEILNEKEIIAEIREGENL